MPKRPNYGGEKRQKEIQRQKKREEKDEKKRLKKEAAGGDFDNGESGIDEPHSDEAESD